MSAKANKIQEENLLDIQFFALNWTLNYLLKVVSVIDFRPKAIDPKDFMLITCSWWS